MTSELPVTQAYAVSDWEMAKQQGFKQAICALANNNPFPNEPPFCYESLLT